VHILADISQRYFMSHSINSAAVPAAEAAPAAKSNDPVAPAAGPSTSEAFEGFRGTYALKPLPPELVANADQIKQMLPEDGLLLWERGPIGDESGEDPGAPTITSDMDETKFLWVVELTRVPYAPERCEFGKSLESGVIKHSNLTGGGDAHCGGEMIKIDNDNIVVNGRSGRYGPKSQEEMSAVAKAFRTSGYNVWSMGFDDEAARPLPFIGVTPVWIR
jgi:hypothetical protein